MSNNVTTIYCYYSSKEVEIPYNEKDQVELSDKIIFKDEDAKEEFGIVKQVDSPSEDEEKIIKGSKVLRKATANDIQRAENFDQQSTHALELCKKLVLKYKLDMQVFKASYSFDGNRVLFLFTADERIDFRELVKELAKSLQKQIYLRQIGPRDKAKIIGGFGKCGRPLCCSTYLGKLESISMEMVRDQSLESKGSAKLSGACGKLLCCLKYEVEAYRDLKKNMPRISSIVRLKKTASASSRDGVVIAVDILNQKIKLHFPDIDDYGVAGVEEIEKVIKEAKEEQGNYRD